VFPPLPPPEGPPLPWTPAKEEPLHISAVVIGSLTRRPVKTVDLEGLRRHEEYEPSRRFTPADWRALLKEARDIAAGKAVITSSSSFETIEDARRFLEET